MQMDLITAAVSSWNYPVITEVSALLNNTLGFIVIVALMLFFFEPRWEKRLKVVAVLLVAVLLSAGVKELTRVGRPCVTLPSKVACPPDYSFPSNHAAIAFALMLAFINKPAYPVYFIFALFTAFSRIYLGVHTFDDVAAGLVLAPIAYQTVEILWKKKR